MKTIDKQNGSMTYLLCSIIAVTSILSGTTQLGSVSNIIVTGAILAYTMIVAINSDKIRITIIILLLISLIMVVINKSVTELAPFIIISLFWVLERSDYHILKQANTVYLVIGFLLFGVVSLSALLTGFNNLSFQIWRGGRLISRLSLGFTHPNVTLVRWYGLVSAFCLVIFRKHRFMIYMLTATITILLYNYTKSRTSTILVLAMLATVSFIERNSKLKTAFEIDSRFLLIVPWFMLILSYSFLKINWMQVHFDALLSGRISIYLGYFRQFGVHMFGNADPSITMIDNSYIQLLITKGILYTFVLLAVYSLIIGSVKKISFHTAAVIFTFFLLGITEATLQHFELILPMLLAISMDRRLEMQNSQKEGSNVS